MRLYNYFLATAESQSSAIFRAASQNKPQLFHDGHLDMRLLLEKFTMHFSQIYGDHAEPFDEEEGRRRFLLYLRPIIGTGNYYIEPQTRNNRRMDVVVDYHGEQFIIELKIWRGNAYNERGAGNPN